MIAMIAAIAIGSMSATDIVDVERATIVQPSDPGTLEVVGGVWLSNARLDSLSSELVRLRTENAAMKQEFQAARVVAIASLVLGAVVGVTATAIVVQQLNK